MMKAQKRYRLHYKLRQRGNKVIARHREVVKRANEVSRIEEKWLKELIATGYGVRNDMFY